jgi:molybdenum cofactor guanylyltransferase
MKNNKNVSVFILAGGKSTRFKKDKTLFPYKGKPLIEYVIEAVKPFSKNVSIVADDCARFEYLQLPCYTDMVKNAGSFGGLYTALCHCSTDTGLLLGCDMPNLNSNLLIYMISKTGDSDIVIPCRPNGWFEPLHAIYSKNCLPIIDTHIKSGKKQIIGFYNEVKLRKITDDEIKRFADPDIVFKNINYPQDIENP